MTLDKTQIQAPDGTILSFGESKTLINENGEEIDVNLFIPQCCREGWANCPHIPKKQRKIKNNIGL